MNTADLPPLHQTDDYFKCIQKGQTFCIVAAKLGLGSDENSTWENLVKENDMMDPSYIHRGICLPPNEEFKGSLIGQTTSLLNRQLLNQNFTIETINCQEEILPMSITEITFLLFLSVIFCFVIVGTLIDTKERKHKRTLEKNVVKFSLKENWKKIAQTTGNEDFNRLKSIQGLRVFTNIGVIFVHAFLNIYIMYYDNPEMLEVLYKTSFFKISFSLAMFLVHIFFMISAFLFSNQVFNHYEKNGCFTFKDVTILVINRYLRLSIPTLVLVFLSQMSIWEPYLGVPGMKLFKINKEACENNWASTLLFTNNLSPTKDICYGASWYMAADFQAYVLIAILLYVILKYKLSILKTMSSVLLCSILVYGISIYSHNSESIIFSANFRELQTWALLYSNKFVVMYTSTLVTLPTSIAGMIFGYLYFKTKGFEIDRKNSVYQSYWQIIFFGLPGLSVYLALYRYNRLLTALLGSVIKVIFSSGFAVGIIAMSHGLGGVTRKFLEENNKVILGNISFCVYLFNYTTVLFSNAGRTDLYTLDIFFMVKEVVIEILLSILGGLILSLVIEQPVLALQKMYLPQLKKKTADTKKME